MSNATKMPLSPPTTLVDAIRKGRDWVRVKEPERVEKIVEKLIAGGKEKAQFVVDFDYTLTRAHKDGQRVDCSWGVMENSSLLPKAYTEKTHALKASAFKFLKNKT